LSEEAQKMAEQSMKSASDSNNEQAQDEAIRAAEKTKECADAANPYNEQDREDLSDAIEKTIEALDGCDPTPEVIKAKDEMEALQRKLSKDETAAHSQWGIWRLIDGQWVQTNYGGDMIFETKDEAAEWLKVRGGQV